jgi:predicted 3-demethylubiquinone-9 3-methyltransferase (glyoxalase superfamily)
MSGREEPAHNQEEFRRGKQPTRARFQFNEAVSFLVRCDNQQEVDEDWSKLSAGGSEGQCGWLKDKVGLSWQIVPAVPPELVSIRRR